MGILLFCLWLIPKILPHADSNEVDIDRRVREIERFLASTHEEAASTFETDSIFDRKPEQHAGTEYFMFDPNGLSVDDWKRLGLSEGQIRVIKNYEAKGGRFYKKEDLKKIYSVSEEDYTRLAPYIQIQQATPKRLVPKHRSDTLPGRQVHVAPHLSIELNAADSVGLQQLPGIGPVFASRIIRFRDALGGFHHLSQLMDVYGMDTARFNGVKEYVQLDSSRVKKIPLNTADYNRLRSHPFIRSKLANAMVQYRKQHGPYRSLSDLLQIAIMNEEIFRKIVPYLTLSDD